MCFTNDIHYAEGVAPSQEGMSSDRGGKAQRPRRERVRAATEREIRDVARGLLVREGLAAVTMRAIAAEMGMTSPAFSTTKLLMPRRSSVTVMSA